MSTPKGTTIVNNQEVQLSNLTPLSWFLRNIPRALLLSWSFLRPIHRYQ
jgi:hypothetical protein